MSAPRRRSTQATVSASTRDDARGIAEDPQVTELALLRELQEYGAAVAEAGAALGITETQLARAEGIVPALESAHAIAFAAVLARKLRRSDWILVNLSGRGDKDLAEYERIRGRGRRRESGRPGRESGIGNRESNS